MKGWREDATPHRRTVLQRLLVLCVAVRCACAVCVLEATVVPTLSRPSGMMLVANYTRLLVASSASESVHSVSLLNFPAGPFPRSRLFSNSAQTQTTGYMQASSQHIYLSKYDAVVFAPPIYRYSYNDTGGAFLNSFGSSVTAARVYLLDNQTQRLYVGVGASGNVTLEVYDITTDTKVATLPSNDTDSVALSPRGLYVYDAAGTVVHYDMSMIEQWRIDTPFAKTGAIRVCSDMLFVSSIRNNTVSVHHALHGGELYRLPVNVFQRPFHMECHSLADGVRLYVAESDDNGAQVGGNRVTAWKCPFLATSAPSSAPTSAPSASPTAVPNSAGAPTSAPSASPTAVPSSSGDSIPPVITTEIFVGDIEIVDPSFTSTGNVTSSGTVVLSGVLTISGSGGAGQTFTLISGSSLQGNFSRVELTGFDTSSLKPCEKLQGQQTIVNSAFSVTIRIDSSACANNIALIAGATVGGVAFLALLVVIIGLACKKARDKKTWQGINNNVGGL